jgi:hypothetical protein
MKHCAHRFDIGARQGLYETTANANPYLVASELDVERLICAVRAAIALPARAAALTHTDTLPSFP